MAAGDLYIRIARVDGGELILDAAGLTDAFFRTDPSSIAIGGYDSRAGIGASDRVEIADIEDLNRTMRARSAHRYWESLIGGESPWLRDIPVDLDLIEAGEAAWANVRGDELVRSALRATIGPGRGVSVATKLLHLKRPRLFPMLDALVAQLLGRPITAETPDGRTEQATQLVLHVRTEGRRNAAVLRAVQQQLAGVGFERSLIRILDAVLWLAHPAAGGPGSRRRFIVEMLGPDESRGSSI